MSPSVISRLHGQIDTPRPLRAPAGKIELHGWCLHEDAVDAPQVRLIAGGETFPAVSGLPRADVAAFFPNHPAASRCGFSISGSLPSGAYIAEFEALSSGETWLCFQRFSLVVEKPSLAAVIDEPLSEGTLRDRVRVGGWAFCPGDTISEVVLRYGHREVPCTIDRPRSDVPLLFPNEPEAARSGFETKDHLVAGYGPVRVRAKLSSGRTAIAPTKLTFDVSSDENHSAEFDLKAPRAALLRSHRTPAAIAPEKSTRPLNILFVLYGSFASNSALHVAAMANELASAGHTCLVAVPHDRETIALHEGYRFQTITFAEAARSCVFKNGRGPDLIHAWTTRENVRRLAEQIASRHSSRVVVHLEDNEQEILALSLGRTFSDLDKLSTDELDRIVPPDLSHPHRSREFLAFSNGVTMITEKLREFVPAGKPNALLTPAADSRYFFPQTRPRELRRALDVAEGSTVIFYHGNVHASNAAEVRELYAAVLQLNRNHHPVTLIRTGLDRANFLGSIAQDVAPFVLELGQIPHHRHLPPLLALADIFVQPGVPDAFNDYRFPSKLPEFFAIGRPVILPRTNLGLALRHRVDAYVLEQANAAGIVNAIRELMDDPQLAASLARGAVEFAERNFSWQRTAEALAKFYATLTG